MEFRHNENCLNGVTSGSALKQQFSEISFRKSISVVLGADVPVLQYYPLYAISACRKFYFYGDLPSEIMSSLHKILPAVTVH
jgi:hypothetical protein